jgi:hypothetical protein
MDVRALWEVLVSTAIVPVGSLILVGAGLLLVVIVVRKTYQR